MKSGARVAIVALLAAAVAATVLVRERKRAGEASAQVSSPPPRVVAVAGGTTAPAPAARPRILEIGSTRCQACLEMAKVLEALRASQGERLQVDFIDVFEKPEGAERYRVSLIPTQILFDPSGKEIFRHQGYFSHDDVLAKFRELGVRL